ncbi:MAG: hypothetical protein M3Y82_06065 [Verrucomicrobiota bacterium]|nr:hypothetical protein [Verrucomicrobiota bacterium]
MNEDKPIPSTIDIEKVACAIRFALVAIVVMLSYLPIRCSFSIAAMKEVFQRIGQPVPPLTELVIRFSSFLIVSSLVIPLAAVATLFIRNSVRAFYCLAGLALVTMVHLVFTYEGLVAPIFLLLDQMGAK